MVYWFDIVWTAVLILFAALAAVSIAQIVQHPKLTTHGKTGWLLLVILVPLLGVAAWLACKPSTVRGAGL